jgi:nucleoside-diphosphate-sugar epimerase
MTDSLLLCGHGYTGRAIADVWVASGGVVWASVRDFDRSIAIERAGVRSFVACFGGGESPLISGLGSSVGVITFGTNGDAAPEVAVESAVGWLNRHRCSALVYLSSTSVYGDCAGRTVNEDAPLAPDTEMGRRRLLAEQAFDAATARYGIRSVILRLPGIYGPGRTPRNRLLDGSYRFPKGVRWSNRIFVDDVATAVGHALRQPLEGAFNTADGAPFVASDFVDWAAGELGLARPEAVDFDALSERAKPFWRANRRVSNDRLVASGWEPSVVDYRAGYRLAWQTEDAVDHTAE